MTSFEKWSAGRSPVTAQKETALRAERDIHRVRKHVRVVSGDASIQVSAGDGGVVPDRRKNEVLLGASTNTVAYIVKRSRIALSVEIRPYRTHSSIGRGSRGQPMGRRECRGS